ncbi:hypothetical protein ZHAS_00021983 [Anopheles sinensis]|uniref:Uncharacterized protein n=1 Tax=Anopheles sinensis TaxID=74873 RepID=A0A084WTD1_ANOSI|nr:hypothetical protein ZHAS_00021983 [Anopheles sinensis]
MLPPPSARTSANCSASCSRHLELHEPQMQPLQDTTRQSLASCESMLAFEDEPTRTNLHGSDPDPPMAGSSSLKGSVLAERRQSQCCVACLLFSGAQIFEQMPEYLCRKSMRQVGALGKRKMGQEWL